MCRREHAAVEHQLQVTYNHELDLLQERQELVQRRIDNVFPVSLLPRLLVLADELQVSHSARPHTYIYTYMYVCMYSVHAAGALSRFLFLQIVTPPFHTTLSTSLPHPHALTPLCLSALDPHVSRRVYSPHAPAGSVQPVGRGPCPCIASTGLRLGA